MFILCTDCCTVQAGRQLCVLTGNCKLVAWDDCIPEPCSMRNEALNILQEKVIVVIVVTKSPK